MTDIKIDPAKAILAWENPGLGIQQGNVILEWTSTCSTSEMIPKVTPFIDGQAVTSRIHASMKAECTRLMSSTCYWGKDAAVAYLAETYDRSRSVVYGAVGLIKRST